MAALLAGTAGIAWAQAASVDGKYRGTATLQGRGCGTIPPVITATIQNRVITRTFGPQYTLTATIKPDGTFDAQAGVVRMNGTVRNGHIELDVIGATCQMHQTMDLATGS